MENTSNLSQHQNQKEDTNLEKINDDPRLLYPEEKGKAQLKRGAGRNTESFDPKSTLVRPSMRIIVGANSPSYGKPTKHDDVIVVPEFFCKESDWGMYYKLIHEMREIQKSQEGKKTAEWISWHEGSHLISKDPSASPTFQMIQSKIAAYFDIELKSVGTRFNWYKDSSDWKPFHHDSAAFNAERAKKQNITVGVSFGATRELAFLSAKSGERIYFPQTNGMLFAFGRDVNINWKHGVNALPESEQDGKGRISIILWGLTPNIIEEEDSPPMLTDNTRGNGYSMHKYDNSNNYNNDDNKSHRRRHGINNRNRNRHFYNDNNEDYNYKNNGYYNDNYNNYQDDRDYYERRRDRTRSRDHYNNNNQDDYYYKKPRNNKYRGNY